MTVYVAEIKGRGVAAFHATPFRRVGDALFCGHGPKSVIDGPRQEGGDPELGEFIQ